MVMNEIHLNIDWHHEMISGIYAYYQDRCVYSACLYFLFFYFFIFLFFYFFFPTPYSLRVLFSNAFDTHFRRLYSYSFSFSLSLFFSPQSTRVSVCVCVETDASSIGLLFVQIWIQCIHQCTHQSIQHCIPHCIHQSIQHWYSTVYCRYIYIHLKKNTKTLSKLFDFRGSKKKS